MTELSSEKSSPPNAPIISHALQPSLPPTQPIDFTAPLDRSILQNKLAIVTGGGSGIGYGIALGLGESGASVGLLDIDPVGGEAAEKQMLEAGFKALFVRCDVSSWEEQVAAFKKVLEWGGKGRELDVVVCSAGLGGRKAGTWLRTREELEAGGEALEPVWPDTKVIDVNLTGSWYTAHLALHYFAATRVGKKVEGGWRPQLVFVASLAGYVETSTTDYAASKYGVRGLWRSLIAQRGEELGANAQINLLAPTYIFSPMTNAVTGILRLRGVKMGTVDDVIQGAMRCICDPEVDARAVACVRGEFGQPGSLNFDLRDDLASMNGGQALVEHARQGVFDL